MNAVAIDGPAGAGKTTVAKQLAEVLGWQYVDTGAMYRALALAAIRAGANPGDAAAVGALARDLEVTLSGGEVFVGGENVTPELRRPDVTQASSVVSKHQEVRSVMVDLQRRAAGEGRVVMEGRDIGTVVLPDAAVKVFLTADLDERAGRRARELDLDRREDSERLKRAIETRDRADEQRSLSPLVQATDAVLIDSSGRTVADIVAEIANLVRASLPGDESEAG